ncbi:MAG TPA: DUF2961 domain-containing protein [Acidobacteriaceae bacterium]|jgi:hypothetical protein|nr:DUF2961 domain-containing protein [Acidobacteriaceae bacterium]
MVRRLMLSITLLLSLALTHAQPACAQTRTYVAYMGSYSAGTVYSLNDMVSLGSDFYISLMANNVDNSPETSASQWALFSSRDKTAVVTGATSATGPAGPAGATGAQGPVGPMGPAGASGAQGAVGPMGPAGPVGAAGPMGLAGPLGATGPAGGAVAETRTMSVAYLKGYNLAGGSSLTLFAATGPGNVERIQLAGGYSAGSPTPIAANTLLTIAVDGRSYSCTLGMFLLWNGYSTSDGAEATGDLFLSKYLGIANGTTDSVSGYRRVYIKYNSSIQISITVPPGPGVVWWSQVDYYPGIAPAGRYTATRNVFHMVANDWASSNLAAGQVLTVLPTVSGPGELESIYFVSSAPGQVEPTWLEMNPDIAVDGSDYRYGGTEDFFGNQFYGDQFHGRADEYGIARYYKSSAPDNTTYWTAYRYFRESPMLFNTSLGMTWQNAAAGSGPATRVGTLAVYYTTN